MRSATPRALTAQHSGEASRPGQRGARLKAGMAMVAQTPTRAVAAMVEKCIMVDWGMGLMDLDLSCESGLESRVGDGVGRMCYAG